MTLEASRQLVDIVGKSSRRRSSGWLAPATVTPEGTQPARLHMAGSPSSVRIGETAIIGCVSYVVESVSYWPPGDLEIVLASAVLADKCRIERRTGRAFDAATNTVTDTWVPIWGGPCDIQARADLASSVDAAGDSTTLERLTASIPAQVADVLPGDRLTVTESADVRLVGRHLAVTGVRMGTTPALRVLQLESAE